MAYGEEGGEGITLASMVILDGKECFDEFRGVGDKGLGVLVDRCDCPNSILPYICVSMVQARACGGQQGLDQLRFSELAKESEGVPTDILIGVLEVISYTVAISPPISLAHCMMYVYSRTRPGSFPALASHCYQAWGKARSRSKGVSSMACSWTA